MADEELTDKLVPLLQEIAEEDGYPPTTRDILEMTELAEVFKTKDTRSLAEWNVCRLAYRLYGQQALEVLTRLHNGRFGLVEEEEVRREFRAQHGEERGFQWKT